MFKGRLDIKLIAVIVVTLLIGFGVQALINIQKEYKDLEEEHSKKFSLLAGSIIKPYRIIWLKEGQILRIESLRT